MLTKNAWADGIKLYRESLNQNDFRSKLESEILHLGEQCKADMDRVIADWKLSPKTHSTSYHMIFPKHVIHPGAKARKFRVVGK